MPSYSILFTELAEREYLEAFYYYEEQLPGLGKKLEHELDVIIKSIAKNPFLFQRKFKHYREVLLKKFPYFIVYEIIGNSVIINSVFHTSRNPKTKIKS